VVATLVAALLISGGGHVLCVTADGIAALESGSLLTGCATERCGEDESPDPVSMVSGSDCVDLLMAGLLPVRPDRGDRDFVVAAPQLLSELPHLSESGGPSCRLLGFVPTEPPDTQQVAVIRSTILLV